MKRILGLIALAAILVGLAGSLSAQQVTTLTRTESASPPLFSFTSGGSPTMVWLGMPFTTGAQASLLTSIVADIKMPVGTEPPGVTATLYAAGSGDKPTGAFLVQFASSGPTQPSFSFITFTPQGGSYALSASTEYVFVLGAMGPNSKTYNWDWTAAGQGFDAAAGWTMAGVATSPAFNSPPPLDIGTLAWSTDTNYRLMGAVNATAVPEPGTYAAIAGLAVLGFAAWRRRRQA